MRRIEIDLSGMAESPYGSRASADLVATAKSVADDAAGVALATMVLTAAVSLDKIHVPAEGFKISVVIETEHEPGKSPELQAALAESSALEGK